jgi:hypothetical protein
MGCGKEFKEKFYDFGKIVDGKVQNATNVDIVTIPNTPISSSNLRLYNLSNKTFTKEYPNRNLFYTRYQVEQYNSDLVLITTNYQVYEKNTNSSILFTIIEIEDSIIPSRQDGKYTGTVTGASGRFEGATKVVLSIVTDPKDSTIKYRTYTVTGYRPKC